MPFKEKDQFEQLCQESARQALTKSEKIKVRGYQIRQGFKLFILALQLFTGITDINRYHKKLKDSLFYRSLQSYISFTDAKDGMIYHYLLPSKN